MSGTKTLILAAATLAVAAFTAAAQTTPTAAAAATDVATTASPELVGLLTSQLGISAKQAEAGAGAVLGYAKTKLKAEDFAKVSKAVPGTDGLLKAAPAADAAPKGASGGMGGALASAATQAAGSSSVTAALAPAFKKIGIPPETGAKVVPVVVGFVTKKGGTNVGDLLAGVLK